MRRIHCGTKQEYTDRTKTAICFVFCLLFAGIMAFFHDSTNVDEIWNYTFASCIARGLVPYRDFNLLQMPVFCMINALAFRIFGQHLLVMRFMGAFLFAGIGTVMYRGAKLLGWKSLPALILPICFILNYEYNTFFEYSCLIVFCQLVMLFADLRAMNAREQRADDQTETDRVRQTGIPGADEMGIRLWDTCRGQFLLGIFGGIAVMSKQTYGGFVMLASWISLVLVSRWLGNDVRRTLRQLFFRMLGSSIPCFAVLFYLLANNAWDDFWEMCVLGIATFSTRRTILQFFQQAGAEDWCLGICFILLLISGVILARRDRRVRLILLCGIAGCINMVPLVNSYHVLTSMVVFWWIAVPAQQSICAWAEHSGREGILRWKNRGERLVRPLLLVGLAAAVIYTGILVPVRQWKESVSVTDLPHWEGIFFPKDTVESYRTVEDYVAEQFAQGKDVYLVDNRAELYLVPLDVYHKYLDMFLYGNLGTQSPAECLEGTLGHGAVYLIPDSSRQEYQYPRTAVTEFCETYLEQIGTVEDFSIWQEKTSYPEAENREDG